MCIRDSHNFNDGSYTYKHVLEGGSYGILMGYYRDTACSVTASPSVGLDNDYTGHLNGGDTAIYDLQLYPFPPSPPPAYIPGNCCNRHNCIRIKNQPITVVIDGVILGECDGCGSCSKLGGVFGCTKGTKCQALCHKFFKGKNGKTCVFSNGDCDGEDLGYELSLIHI